MTYILLATLTGLIIICWRYYRQENLWPEMLDTDAARLLIDRRRLIPVRCTPAFARQLGYPDETSCIAGLNRFPHFVGQSLALACSSGQAALSLQTQDRASITASIAYREDAIQLTLAPESNVPPEADPLEEARTLHVTGKPDRVTADNEVGQDADSPLLPVIEDRDSVQATRILIVDDEPTVRHHLRETLQSAGYEVSEQVTGVEALGELEAQPCNYHLVITDQQMPGMSGSELAACIRQRWPDLPVMICSGSADDSSNLQKPVSAEVLLTQTHQLLSQSALTT